MRSQQGSFPVSDNQLCWLLDTWNYQSIEIPRVNERKVYPMANYYRVTMTTTTGKVYQTDCTADSAKIAKEEITRLFYETRHPGNRSVKLFEGQRISTVSARKIPQEKAFIGSWYEL